VVRRRKSKTRFLPPDWSIYLIVLGVILLRANLSNNDVEAIEPPPLGASLPDIRPNDPAVMVELGVRQSGSGTAFSIDGSGTWLTARHVVDSCDRVGLRAACAARSADYPVARFWIKTAKLSALLPLKARAAAGFILSRQAPYARLSLRMQKRPKPAPFQQMTLAKKLTAIAAIAA